MLILIVAVLAASILLCVAISKLSSEVPIEQSKVKYSVWLKVWDWEKQKLAEFNDRIEANRFLLLQMEGITKEDILDGVSYFIKEEAA